MNREQKAATIEALVSEIEHAEAVFAVDYRGISVPQAAELRTKLRDAEASFRVVKNSLTERAADQAGATTLKPFLQGPTALTFVRGDAALAAKAIADYARATQLLPFKGGLLNGDTLDADQVRAISRLPSREALYGQLVGMVASPVTGLVRTLGALVGGLAVALGQVREKKESGEIPAGAAPAPAPASEPSGGEPSAGEAAASQAPADDPTTAAASGGSESEAVAEESAPPSEESSAPLSDEVSPPDATPAAADEARAPDPAPPAAADEAPAPDPPSHQDDNQADASA